MKKFLFITDTHFRDDTPKERIDDIYQSQFLELAEILNIVQEYDIDAVLHGGDFFHTKKPSHYLVTEIIEWCKRIHVPIFSVIGNHDVIGYNLDSVQNSGLGVLFESGAVDRLDLEVYKKDKIVIKGAHVALNLDQNYTFGPEYNDYFKIVVSHNYIIPSETMPFGFVHPRDINTNASLVLCGHYHTPFDYSKDSTRWINPGALSRWSLAEKDHAPTALLIQVEQLDNVVQYIPLKTTKPGSEIFNLNLVQQEKKQERDIKDFVDSLQQTSFQNIDIEQVIKEAGKAQNVSVVVINLLLKKAKQAKEALQ